MIAILSTNEKKQPIAALPLLSSRKQIRVVHFIITLKKYLMLCEAFGQTYYRFIDIAFKVLTNIRKIPNFPLP